jgi:ribosomal protein S27AE
MKINMPPKEDKRMNDFPSQENSYTWEGLLDENLLDLQDWLSDPEHIDEALAAVASVLRDKHHDYGENNLKDFGELGILVRASDKIARLKNLVDTEANVTDESRADTWRDLAGYAIQALIMMKMRTLRSSACTKPLHLFEIRKNRLIRGMCPDCGEGVLLRMNFWENRLRCSNDCGFTTGDLYSIHLSYPSFTDTINYLASQEAYREQK